MIEQLLENHALGVAAIAWALAQSSKMVINLVREGRLQPRYLKAPGGMPSSHSALVAALTVKIGMDNGVGSGLFAVALVFSAIVLYDAAGVRRAVSSQARVLNQILDEAFASQRFSEQRLRDLLGHTPFEVFVGVLLGIATAISLA